VSPRARAATVVIALAAFVVVVAFLVRAVVLTVSDLSWELPGWLARLSSGAGWASAAAGVAAAALAIFCLVTVWRLAAVRGEGRGDVLVGEGERAVVVRATALEHLLAGVFDRDVRELKDVRVRLRHGASGCHVAVAAVVGPGDLTAVHRRVCEAAARELERAVGLQVAKVDLDVDGFSR
jgi:hypothetical protein